MAEQDIVKSLEILKQSSRVTAAIAKYEMSLEEQKTAFHIFLSIYKEDMADIHNEFISDIKKMDDGRFVRVMITNARAMMESWEANILSNELLPFSEALGEVKKNEWRIEALNHFRTLMDGEHNKNLYIYGSPSTGKTFFVKRFVKSIAAKGKTVAYANVPALWDIIQKSIREKQNITDKVINIFSTADYLFFDDIGAENVNAWFRDSILFIILDRRMESNKINFFTSNLSLAELENVEARVKKAGYNPDPHKSRKLVGRIKNNAKIISVK